MTYYKVFFQESLTGKLWSTNHGRNSSKLEQVYSLDKINLPKFKYPILAFENIFHAKAFATRHDIAYFQHETGNYICGKDVVAEVEGEISPEKIEFLLDPTEDFIGIQLRRRVFRKDLLRKARRVFFQDIFTGIIGLNSITSIKIVWSFDSDY